MLFKLYKWYQTAQSASNFMQIWLDQDCAASFGRRPSEESWKNLFCFYRIGNLKVG